MEIATWQVVVITIIAFLCQPEVLSIAVFKTQPVMYGMITGLIMGDLETGLIVGGTLQLMILGISTFGGSSIPDYTTGAIIGTVYAVLAGEDASFGIALAVPVGLLMVQLDILARYLNVFLADKIDKHVKNDDRKGIERTVRCGIFTWGLSRAVPMFLMLVFGSEVVTFITENIPTWLTSGLSVAGGLLPAVGIAILLRYLPVKERLPFLLIGFGLGAYLGLSITGIAIFGSAAAILIFKSLNNPVLATASGPVNNAEGGYYDGEYEE
ncbi:PTS mannose/fructose/sorbose/N-acetylgalactosamine transporter subunit IIC [Tannockella kyphosi]|uniref:PTS mannose/fructose/sorbose/N-acetylgalactosamine transporter subunit IIC n=1 Tax=Tannockella kyphosi TaxID=2899121 RepID=UPI002011FD66|nr:PTS sugar transporter subunit IIC [Tannockella kyphosi]